MKRNTLKVTVIVAAVATIGFLVTACPNNQEEDKKPDTGIIPKELRGRWNTDNPHSYCLINEDRLNMVAWVDGDIINGFGLGGYTVNSVETVKNTNADEAVNVAFPNGYKLTGTVASGVLYGRPKPDLYILFSKDSEGTVWMTTDITKNIPPYGVFTKE